MNVAKVGSLTTTGLTGTWYRAINTKYIGSALDVAYTAILSSRYSRVRPHSFGPNLLYLAENHQVALMEVGALLGNSWTPHKIVPSAVGTFTILSVSVNLERVVDLTNVQSQTILGTSAQEVTGDWQGYQQRSSSTGSVPAPTGSAPTQEVGAALFKTLFGGVKLEGFLTISAKVPDRKCLVTFPQNFDSGSHIRWDDPLTGKVVELNRP